MDKPVSDVFISYSSEDERLALFAKTHLEAEGISVFVAASSLAAGSKWNEAILNSLSGARLVLVLVSRASSRSAFVNQEIGAALSRRKDVIPVVWDMDPSALPGFLTSTQALSLRGKSIEQISADLSQVGRKVRIDKRLGLAGLAILCAGLIYLGRDS
jgi:TIR domain-containing protein